MKEFGRQLSRIQGQHWVWAGLLSVAIWLALAFWFRLTILLNAQISPSIPLYLLLTIGMLFLVGTKLARPQAQVGIGRVRNARGILIACVLLGIACCFLVGLLCFLISGVPVEAMAPVAELSGIAATSTVIALPIYVGLTEEVAFRGIFQRRLNLQFNAVRSVLIASGLFMALHFSNHAFGDFWPFYLSVSIVCGLMVAQFDSLLAAMCVHGGVNLAGSLFPDLLNSSAESLRGPAVETGLSLLVALTAVALAYCVRAASRATSKLPN